MSIVAMNSVWHHPLSHDPTGGGAWPSGARLAAFVRVADGDMWHCPWPHNGMGCIGYIANVLRAHLTSLMSPAPELSLCPTVSALKQREECYNIHCCCSTVVHKHAKWQQPGQLHLFIHWQWSFKYIAVSWAWLFAKVIHIHYTSALCKRPLWKIRVQL